MRKSFNGGDGCEVCRITKNESGTKYLICDDGIAMREVSYVEFCAFFEKFDIVTAKSWNKKWREEYLEMRRFLYE